MLTSPDLLEWEPCSEEAADYALNCLPPIYFSGGFLNSEPFCHLPTGEAVFSAYAQRRSDGQWYSALATRKLVRFGASLPARGAKDEA